MKLDKKALGMIRRLWKAGHSVREIAQKTQLQPAVVARAVKRLRQQENYLERRGGKQ